MFNFVDIKYHKRATVKLFHFVDMKYHKRATVKLFHFVDMEYNRVLQLKSSTLGTWNITELST